MTYQTLKYYCNEGLVPNVKRGGSNRRVFDEKDVKWIKDLTCLKKCGFSIQEMKEYLELCLQGESTIIPRKKMPAKKQEALRISIKELDDSVAYINWKQNFYDEVLSGRRPYVSNLIRSEKEGILDIPEGFKSERAPPRSRYGQQKNKGFRPRRFLIYLIVSHAIKRQQVKHPLSLMR